MKTATFPVTESGIPLLDKEDGFVMYGCLFKGDGEGGLIGSGKIRDILDEQDVEPTILTVTEFFDSLCLKPEVFLDHYNKRKPMNRSFSDSNPAWDTVPDGYPTNDRHVLDRE